MYLRKNIGLTFLAAWTSLAGCGISRQTSSLPRNHDPIAAFVNDTTNDNHLRRALSIARQEKEAPKGFHVHNSDFVETKNVFLEPDPKTSTTIGMNVKSGAMYLKAWNKRPATTECQRHATIFLGYYDEQPEEMKNLFTEGQVAAKKRHSHKGHDPLQLASFDSSSVFVRTHLGNGFIDEIKVNMRDSTIAHFACGKKTSESKSDYTRNKRGVCVAETFRNDSRYRFTDYFKTYRY